MSITLRTAALSASALFAVACSQAEAPASAPEKTEAQVTAAPAADTGAAEKAAKFLAEANKGVYEVEKTHAFLFWSVSHNGMSKYVAKFTDWDATIDFDPANPMAAKVTAEVNPASVQTDHPTDAEKWHTELATDAKFFNTGEFPKATFTSTNLEQTGPLTAKMTGDFTFLGVTKPITFDVKFNGVNNKPWFGERDLLGISAKAKFSRSDFGLTHMVKEGPNGEVLGIGDEVSVMIEAEFLQKEDAPASE